MTEKTLYKWIKWSYIITGAALLFMLIIRAAIYFDIKNIDRTHTMRTTIVHKCSDCGGSEVIYDQTENQLSYRHVDNDTRITHSYEE